MSTERPLCITNAIAENLKLLNSETVGLDIDAVTQATHTNALGHVSRQLKLKNLILKEQLTTYWALVGIVQRHGYSYEDALAIAKNAWNRDEVFLESPPVPGITTLLKILRDLEIPHVFISSRPVQFLETTRKWFLETFPWIKPENVILGRQEGVDGGDFKAAIIRERNIGLHIEDALEEADVIARNTLCKVLLVPQPWNTNILTDNPRIKRLGPYSNTSGVWPVIRYLASLEAKTFLDVVQC